MTLIAGNPVWNRSSVLHAGTRQDPLPTWTFDERLQLARADLDKKHQRWLLWLGLALALGAVYFYTRR